MSVEGRYEVTEQWEGESRAPEDTPDHVTGVCLHRVAPGLNTPWFKALEGTGPTRSLLASE